MTEVLISRFSLIRLVFTSDGVTVEVLIRSVELYDLVKTTFWFRLRLPRLRSSENWVFGVGSRSGSTKPNAKRGNVYCDWFILSLLLPTPTIWFLLNCKRRSHKRSRKKWKRSDSSDSDSIAVMTLPTTPIFDFHWVISALTTPLTTLTPTPSLVKAALFCSYWSKLLQCFL